MARFLPPVDVATGFWIALVVPFHLSGRRLSELMSDNAAPRRPREAREAMVAFRWMLRRLAWFPFWKTTCLYLSAGESLILRMYGVPARLRIGVRREGDPEGSIAAHAWVEYPSQECDPAADRYHRLQPRPSPSS